MSIKLSKEDVLYIQRCLKFSGYDTGPLDGVYGPKTTKAMSEFQTDSSHIKNTIGIFDNTSEKNIISLHPKVQELARKFMLKANYLDVSNDISIQIISGVRTYSAQTRLYSQGRDSSGKVINANKIVTYAKAGESYHNFMISYDIGVFKKGYYIDNDETYKLIYDNCMVEGLEWGGEWKKFKDFPHYQVKTLLTIKTLRKNFENGVKLIL